jgi:D-glycero-D-manno-heptose 1,7-bisphosphate phosphatase
MDELRAVAVRARDGFRWQATSTRRTVIEERPYLHDPKQVRLLPNAAAGLRALRDAGLKLALVTNQSGVGRGLFGLDAVSRVNERVIALLAREGVTIDEVFVCPHAPEEGCACRKPGTRMLETAARRLGADPSKTFVIGDKLCDIEMGRRAGATALLVRTGWGRRPVGRRCAPLYRRRPHWSARDSRSAGD